MTPKTHRRDAESAEFYHKYDLCVLRLGGEMTFLQCTHEKNPSPW